MLEELTKLDLRNGSARVQEINADCKDTAECGGFWKNADGMRIEVREKFACGFPSGYNISVAKLPVRERDGRQSDTPQKIQDLQITLLRKASVADRISRAFMLSEAMINLSRQGLKRRHPELSPKELDLLFIEYCYGTSLAQRVRIQSERKHP